MGGFLSKNRNFFYACSQMGLNSSGDATACRLIKLNIVSVDGSADAINGLNAGEGDAVGNWPSRRGFMGNYYYLGYGMSPTYYLYGIDCTMDGGRKMAKDTGVVYFTSSWQYSGPVTYISSSSVGGMFNPTYVYGAYGYGNQGLYAFDAEVGGNIQVLHNPSWTQNGTGLQGQNHMLEVSDDGRSVAQIVSDYYYYMYFDSETLRSVWNITFDADGSLSSSFNPNTHTTLAESSWGASASRSHSWVRTTICSTRAATRAAAKWAREFKKFSVDPGGTGGSSTPFGLNGRFNVLGGGR